MGEHRQELAEKALEDIGNGSHLKKIAKELGCSYGGLSMYLTEHYPEMYTRARESRTQAHVDYLTELEVDLLMGSIEPAVYREIKDRVKWQAGKENKGLYGDHKHLEHSGKMTLTQMLNEMGDE